MELTERVVRRMIKYFNYYPKIMKENSATLCEVLDAYKIYIRKKIKRKIFNNTDQNLVVMYNCISFDFIKILFYVYI